MSDECSQFPYLFTTSRQKIVVVFSLSAVRASFALA